MPATRDQLDIWLTSATLPWRELIEVHRLLVWEGSLIADYHRSWSQNPSGDWRIDTGPLAGMTYADAQIEETLGLFTHELQLYDLDRGGIGVTRILPERGSAHVFFAETSRIPGWRLWWHKVRARAPVGLGFEVSP